MAYRRKSRQPSIQAARFVQETGDLTAAAAPQTPRDLAAVHIIAETVLSAVETLSERQKQAIRLIYFQGLSRAEASRRMGITWQTLQLHEQVALKKLRHLLNP